MFVALPVRGLSIAIIATIVGTAAFREVIHVVGMAYFTRGIDYTILTHFDFMAIGCGLALFFFHRREQIEKFVAGRAVAIQLASLALVFGVPFVEVLAPNASTLAISVHAFAMASIVATVLVDSKGLAAILRHPALVTVGLWSYSLYLWQQPLTAGSALSFTAIGFLTIPGINLVAMLLVAGISYRYVETPFRRRASAALKPVRRAA